MNYPYWPFRSAQSVQSRSLWFNFSFTSLCELARCPINQLFSEPGGETKSCLLSSGSSFLIDCQILIELPCSNQGATNENRVTSSRAKDSDPGLLNIKLVDRPLSSFFESASPFRGLEPFCWAPILDINAILIGLATFLDWTFPGSTEREI